MDTLTDQDTQSDTLSAYLKLSCTQTWEGQQPRRNPIRFPICGVKSGLGQSCCEAGRGCNVGTPLVTHSEANWLVAIPTIQFCSLEAALATRQIHFNAASPPRPIRGLCVAYRFCSSLAYVWPLCWLLLYGLRGPCGFTTEVVGGGMLWPWTHTETALITNVTWSTVGP